MSPSSLVGTIVAERYRIDRLLGEGGMGAVYRAQHVHMQRAVAIKILHPPMIAVEEAVRRFEREAIAAARIDHPNVAAGIDFGRLDQGSFYFVMEYLPGQTLAKLLKKRGKLPIERCVIIARQIAAALGAAHAVDIVHRDLKPDNVMLVEKSGGSDHVKVLDFGIAKIATGTASGSAALTQIGSVFGTPQYMAPEQAAGGVVDARADLYSLGLILHEMLSGKPVFEADEVLPLLAMQMTEAPRALPARVPPNLGQLVMQLLEKQPELRPGSAEEVMLRIDALGDRPAPAVRAPAPASPSSEEIARPGRPTHEPKAKGWLARVRALLERGAASPGKKRGARTFASLARARRSKWFTSGLRAKRRSARRMPIWVWAAIGVTALAVPVGLHYAHLLPWPKLHGQPADTEPAPEAQAVQDRRTDQPGPDEKSLDPQLQKLLAEARRGTQSALDALEQRNQNERSKFEWLALGEGRLKRGQIAEALKAYERALAADPSLARDSRMLAGLRYFAGSDANHGPILEFARDHLGSNGADLIFHVWSSTNRATPATQQAKELLEDERVRKNMSRPLRLAVDLRKAQSCDEVKTLLPEIASEADARSLTRLMELTKQVGCGNDKKQDCYPCLRDSSMLKDAIAQVRTRRVPSFDGWR